LTLLVTVSCAKLPVLEIMAPEVEVAEEEDPVPHSCSGVTLGPEIGVFAGMVLPSAQGTATPVLHGPTATPVGVGIFCCAPAKPATAAVKTAAIINERFLMFCLAAAIDVSDVFIHPLRRTWGFRVLCSARWQASYGRDEILTRPSQMG
jgi:hypothetical protein